MKEILLKTTTLESRIFVGDNSLERIPALTKTQKNFVITDKNVYSLHSECFKEYFLDTAIFVLQAGEENKNFQTLSKILERMLESGLNRESRVFAVGGGMVGDVAGLASALFMRGISYVQIPTTLLAQIDSGVGGKTALNHGGVKNSIGAFHQPMEVLIAPQFLKTLPAREIKCGMGELVKYAALDHKIFHGLLGNEQILTQPTGQLETLITRCIELKARVVERDEKERGERKSLNVGHTTGHAIELSFGFSHGESVLYGMAFETLIAMNKGVCDRAYGEKLLSIIWSALDISPKTQLKVQDIEKFADKAKFDKKNASDEKIVMAVAKAEGEWELLALDYEEYVHQLRFAMEQFSL
ncbi:MAG: 3-dehydroquinate synthase [Clostridia bacterium]|nr:3-dehydroquinate synthase [Clostridia bacterium]